MSTTKRVHKMLGEDMVTVTRTKRDRILIHETDCVGETSHMSLTAFQALERRAAAIREMIDEAKRP